MTNCGQAILDWVEENMKRDQDREKTFAKQKCSGKWLMSQLELLIPQYWLLADALSLHPLNRKEQTWVFIYKDKTGISHHILQVCNDGILWHPGDEYETFLEFKQPSLYFRKVEKPIRAKMREFVLGLSPEPKLW